MAEYRIVYPKVAGSNPVSLAYIFFLWRSKMNDLYFEFLDDLRASATMNMMGAPRELENEFGLNKIQARSIFQLWCLNLEGE